MSLPPELHNQIYELVLVEATPLTLDGDKDGRNYSYKGQHTAWFEQVANGAWLQPALTRVSHQIRMETLPIFYGQNTFRGRFGVGAIDYWYLPRWLFCIGHENCKLIRRIEMHDCDYREFDVEPYVWPADGAKYNSLATVVNMMSGFGAISRNGRNAVNLKIWRKIHFHFCENCITGTDEAWVDRMKVEAKRKYANANLNELILAAEMLEDGRRGPSGDRLLPEFWKALKVLKVIS